MSIENLIPEGNKKKVEDAKRTADWTKNTSGSGQPQDAELYSKDWLKEAVEFYIRNEIRPITRNNFNEHPNYPSADVVAKKLSDTGSFNDAVDAVVSKMDIDDDNFSRREIAEEFVKNKPEVIKDRSWKIRCEPSKFILKEHNLKFVITPKFKSDKYEWKLYVYRLGNEGAIYETYGTLKYDQYNVPERVIIRVNRGMRMVNNSIELTEISFDKLHQKDLYELECMMGVETVDPNEGENDKGVKN